METNCLIYNDAITETDIRLQRHIELKVILCASEHICSIVQYCLRSFKQL